MVSSVIHRAPWVLPIVQPPVKDGAVAVSAGKIVAVGRYRDIVAGYSDAEVKEYPESALLPGLINAHTHLELSHLAHLSQQPAPATFTGWIENMLAARAEDNSSPETIEQAARTALAQQQDDGVVAVADISNTGLTRNLASSFSGNLICLKEFLGLNQAGVEPILHTLQAEEEYHLCTAHAPYSTHALLLKTLKQRARKNGHIFSIHVAESEAEIAMIQQGRGDMRDFLEQRGFWDGSFQPLGSGKGIDKQGSVRYLHQLGLLDAQTLCVHAIHLSDQEIDLLAQTGAKVCLCPGSNQYLDVGKAPVEKYLKKGMLPALGTDSLTSNPEISIWREMRLLARQHPAIAPQDILSMATLGGATALGLNQSSGSLEAGKEAAILAVPIPESTQNTVTEYLVDQGGTSVQRILNVT